MIINGCGPYLYEYKSVRQPDGTVRGVYVAYHGKVHMDTTEAVNRDLKQRGSDVELALRLREKPRKFVVFDLETTGLSSRDEPWEFCGFQVKWYNRELRIEKEFYERARPSRKLSPQVEKLCGVKDEDLDGLPSTAEVYSRFHRFIGRRVQSGHNVAFDQRMMDNYARRHGYTSLREDRICTMVLSRRVHPHAEQHNLESCVTRDKVRVDGDYHSAVTDTQAVVELLEKYTLMIDTISDSKPSQCVR